MAEKIDENIIYIDLFTFHNGWIMAINLIASLVVVLVFTFHNGWIMADIKISNIICLIHLHSTMVGL